jgi:hypothetical protein
MKRIVCKRVLAASVAALFFAACASAPQSNETPESLEAAKADTADGTQGSPHVAYADFMGSSPNLRDLPERNLGNSPEVRQRPRKWLPGRQGAVGTPGDGAFASSTGTPTPADTTLGTGWDGIGNVDGVLPPDPSGEAGPNHYVQAVNLSFAVWNKSGTLLKGPVNMSSLWSAAGGVCSTTNDGDPIVQYDHLEDRWLLSQFALPNFPYGAFYQCIAVSKTADPTGAYHLYTFKISNSKMNDYPKFGVWPDGYYMAVNQFKQGTLGWGGQGVVAFERAKMLTGAAARMIYFDLYNTDANLGGMLPSDLDGPAPPAGTPNYFAVMDDDAWGYSPDQLQIWKFTANWSNPRKSKFVKEVALTTAAFDSDLCGYARNCIPQPGGVAVDSLSDRLMYRLQFRYDAATSRYSLVSNHTVDVGDFADHAGIRWFELRKVGAGAWTIHQQGTHAPDSDHRTVGSVAMDAAGNLVLGYSVMSTATYPSVRVTHRCAGDPLGTMRAETTLVTGSGVQSHSSGRWGDYSQMSLDPTDGSFWYTQEYYKSGASAAGWSTYIGNFAITCP